MSERELQLIHDSQNIRETLKERRQGIQETKEDINFFDIEENASKDATKFSEWWISELEKDPKTLYRIPGSEQKKRETYLESFQKVKEKLQYLGESIIPGILKKFGNILVILPSINIVPFEQYLLHLQKDIDSLIQNEKVPDEVNKLEQYTRLNVPFCQVNHMIDKLDDCINGEANQHFYPLIERARADVRMYLIQYANTKGIPLEEVQDFFSRKLEKKIPFSFLYTLNIEDISKMKEDVLADVNIHNSIRINLDRAEIFENGELNEGNLLSTFVHELVHTVSHRSEEGIYSLEDAEIFKTQTHDADKFAHPSYGELTKNPEINLNELSTELLTIDIVKKYYKENNNIGTLNFHKTVEQSYAYQSLIEDFIELEESLPQEMSELRGILYNGMMSGELLKLKEFFERNPDIYNKIKKICTLENHYNKTKRGSISI
jgi:hypothetical protein